MIINDMIKYENQTIKWIATEFNNGNLYVDDSFQRRYVWLKKHQIRLIETILMGYVIPEIYIWKVGTNPDTGDTKFSIVDGQQRIGAIVSFLNGDFKLNKAYLSEKNANYSGKYFSELTPTEKENIWGYSLSLRKILQDVKREDIVNLFLRLNSTDKSLNPQELRNAEYDGLFIKNAMEIARFDFWQKYRVFSADALRRMGDVEFISSLLIFLRKGIESEITQSGINQMYDMYNDQYDEAEEDKTNVECILNQMDKIVAKDESGEFAKFVRKNTHLYTIFIAIYKILLKYKNMSGEQIKNIIEFYSKYENSYDKISMEYRELFQEGTRAKANRIRRVKILSDVIEGKIKI
ncbi:MULTISPECIES: DUF262 domain-containing protein [unclassified Eubacterium (in: firmicutes)]|jgi:hypothetical protein|uniref:DUF262 domain-containing protein n=1 Tax=Eubacterium TaxID=1730 RepID=UPI000E4C4884|nr:MULTISPECIES: DUF262 domain-containing protein [unclassified Eubacterium (in: firmicutes)]RGF49892.1 DUF262 domain-containing protein [Eubacterium sp. AF36-5BH]RHP21118.1 DUF262 domain-containing protein [Eubacterium sp. AF34-35BH]